MKPIYCFKKVSLLLLVVTFTAKPLQETPWEWVKNHKEMVLGGTAIAGLLITMHFMIPALAKRYIENVVASARRNVVDKQSAKSQQPIDAKTHTMLQKTKEAVTKKTKTHTQSGISVTGTASFSGTLNIAHAISFLNQSFSGSGLVKRCLSFSTTVFNGDFIAETCAFKGAVVLEKETNVIAFRGSFLGSLKSKGKKVVVELFDTVVAGDIVFEHSGTLVIDANTILGGKVVNGTIVRVA